MKTYEKILTPIQVANILLSTCRTRMVQHRKDIERHNLACWKNRTRVDQPMINPNRTWCAQSCSTDSTIPSCYRYLQVMLQSSVSLWYNLLSKNKLGYPSVAPFHYVYVKLHLLDVFSLASNGVWQQAGLQHIGFAAHVCRFLNFFSVGCSLCVYSQSFHLHMG